MIKKLRKKLNGDVHLKEVLKGSSLSFILKMSGMALSYLLIVVISKYYGSKGVGFYNLLYQSLVVVGINLALGINISVLRYVGQFNTDIEKVKLRKLYKNYISLIAPISIFVCVILYLSSNFFANIIHIDKEFLFSLKALLFVVPLYTINQISVEFIRGLKKVAISEFLRSITIPLFLIIGLSVFARNYDIELIVYILAIAILFNSIISSITIWKNLRKIKVEVVQFTKRELLSTSIPIMWSNIASSLLVALPIFCIGYFFSEEFAGKYSVIFKISQLITIILFVINTMTAPKFSELFWADKHFELNKIVNQTSKILFYVGLSTSIIIISFAHQILCFFGKEYTDIKIELALLVLAQFINVSCGSVGVILNMTGNQKTYRNILLITFIFHVISCLILIKYFSIFGAAISILISYSILNITSAIVIYKKYRIQTFHIPFIKKI